MAITLDGSNGITTPGGATTDDITFADNDKAIFGAGSDLQIYHDGSQSFIKDAGTGELFIQGDTDVRITNSAGSEFKANFITNGAVDLYYDNSKKLATTSTGIDVTGTVSSVTSASGVQPLLKLYQANNTSGNKWGIDFSRTTGSASDSITLSPVLDITGTQPLPLANSIYVRPGSSTFILPVTSMVSP